MLMNKLKVRAHILDYLRRHNINNCLINDNNKIKLVNDLDTICISYNVNIPGGVESDIHLYAEDMHIRAYYSQQVAEACKNSCNKEYLLNIINFINANVFFDSLYTPRLYLSTDGYYDIAITAVIPYDFFELAPIETCEYITAYCPEFLEKFAFPIIGLIHGTIPFNQAIFYIKKEILGDENAVIEWEGDD